MLCCSKTSIPEYEITNIHGKANVLNDFRRVKSTLTVLASPVLDAVKLLSDYKGRHAKSSKHIGQKVEFYPVLSASQTTLNFTKTEDEEPVAKGANRL